MWAAHLHSLKAFDKKVAELCLQHFDQDLGLRSPNMQELLAADREIWNLISELYSQNWSLDDALYERTSVRGDLSSLLQPRPRVQTPTQPAAPFKGNGAKGKGNQGRKRTADWESEQHVRKAKAEAASPQTSPPHLSPQSLTTGPRTGSLSSGASSYADATAGGSATIRIFARVCGEGLSQRASSLQAR